MSPVLALSAFAMGLLGSTHCVMMCGGIVTMSCSALPLDRRARPLAQLPYILAYNGGRIGSYSIAGAAAGAVGATLAASEVLGHAQLALQLAAGIMMIAVGLYLSGFSRVLGWAERIGQPVWMRVVPLARRLVPVRTPLMALALGSLWGWMPCGLVYAAVAAAVTSGSALGGAATMAAFGLGTLPTLVAMGSASALLVRAARQPWIRRITGVLVVAFGMIQLGHVGRALDAPAGATPTCCTGHHP